MEPFDTFLMRRMLVQVGGVIAIAAILGGFIVAYNATYAGVADLDRQADAGWAGITRDMAERYGPIPGLAADIGTTLGSRAPAFDEVSRNLSRWEAAIAEGDMGGINRATTDLEASLSRLTGILKGDPGFAASGEVREFLAILERTEENLSADQSRYNEGVREYNRAITSFPADLWTENWGFPPRGYFTAKIGSREPPPAPAE
jgi:LemA protein